MGTFRINMLEARQVERWQVYAVSQSSCHRSADMKLFSVMPHQTTRERLRARPVKGILTAVMDGSANLTFSSAVLVQIEANVQWIWRKGNGGNYVAICDPLNITLQAASYSELMEDIAHSLDALLKDLMESHELDQFMRDHGWKPVAPIPARPKDMWFDVPFTVMPAMAGMNGSQRSLHQ